jgi:hypothetical protein
MSSDEEYSDDEADAAYNAMITSRESVKWIRNEIIENKQRAEKLKQSTERLKYKRELLRQKREREAKEKIQQKQPKLKIGVKRINETEAAIKNQEKTIKSKKKQILNEQEYLNSMDKIMTGESNFIDNKGKWAVATELDVKEGLNPKIRRALKKSIIEQANKIKGTNIIMDF